MPELTNEEVDRIINAELQLVLSGKFDETAPATAEGAVDSTNDLSDENGNSVYAYRQTNTEWRLANEEMVRKSDCSDFVMARDLVGLYYAINKKYGVDGDALTMFRTVDSKCFVRRMREIQEHITKEGNGDLYKGFNLFMEGKLSGRWGYYDNNLRTLEKPAIAADISFSELLDHVEKHKEVFVGRELSPKLVAYLIELERSETNPLPETYDEKYGHFSQFIMEGFLFKKHYSGAFYVKVLTEQDLRNIDARRKRIKKDGEENKVRNHFSTINRQVAHVLYRLLSKETGWFCRLRISRTRDLLRAAKTIGCRNEFRNCEEYVKVIKTVNPELLAKYKSRSHLYRKLCAYFLAEHRRLVKS